MITAEESDLVARLSLEQKVRLLTGADGWTLHREESIGLRALVLSDGPAGVRGTHFDSAHPSTSLPSPISLASTWDERLVHDVAFALGLEARAKGVDVLLAPTMNIIRTPLSGRGFECFSEDPVLSARIAVAYVRGVQDAGVAATAKHFVANDSETERRTYDARVPETVLRELYLVPFEACVVEADVALVMAAYNSVNGAFMSANRPLLRDLLKSEWGFRGVVVSDWSGTYTTAQSARAGLDLVMPGPRGPWGEALVAEVEAGAVDEKEIDDKVSRLLALARRVGALDGGAAHSVGQPAPARFDEALLKQVTERSFVLLANPRGVLPLRTGKLEKVALIGPNAVHPQTQGGGSVRVLSTPATPTGDALGDALDAFVSVHPGCITSATVAAPEEGTLHDPVSGKAGMRVAVRTADGSTVHDAPFPSHVVTWWDGLPPAVHQPGSEVILSARYRPKVDGAHVLGVAGVGLLRVFVNGSLIAEGATESPRDAVEALSKPPELRVPVELKAGREVEVRIEHRPGARGQEEGFASLRLGLGPEQEDDRLIADAVVAAAGADVAVVVVGSADGTESEGYDRETMALPGRQDELIQRVAAANANTVVVVNSGTPVLMPWAGDVAAVIQVWFPGQAFSEALADVLSGVAEPGGRLPVSMPRAEADAPVLRATPVQGRLDYAEGLLVGYRGYDRREIEPLFPFGHGLGYTTWEYEAMTAGEGMLTAGQDLAVSVTVRNSGARGGREVVQLYVEGPDDDPQRPLRVLGAFVTVAAAPGERGEALLAVPARAFARYEEGVGEWVTHRGTYTLRVGSSSRDLRLHSRVVVR
ncbi:MAG TPA: glycoside hydrolase family 3 C-terminal domain-containing protein [Candidatus Dormibacteraeota bacterium]